MIDLPFKESSYGEGEKQLLEKKAKLSKEKKLMGDDIRNILIEKFKPPFLTTIERSIGGYSGNPFDLVVGDTRNIEMVGFEVKGDTDNYSRLNTQLDSYTLAFSEVYLVLHKKEAPKWLPRFCGVIRVFSDKTVFIEKRSLIDDALDVSTDYEWDTILKMNNIAGQKSMISKAYSAIGNIRKNVLFNRFFAVYSGYSEHKYSKYYPLTDYQKSVLIGFNVPFQVKAMTKETNKLQKRLDVLKQAIGLCNQQESLNTQNTENE